MQEQLPDLTHPLFRLHTLLTKQHQKDIKPGIQPGFFNAHLWHLTEVSHQRPFSKTYNWITRNKAMVIKSIKASDGFSLSELLISVSIVGLLSSIAIPNYLNQIERSRQNEASATITQIQTTIATHADEFGSLPTSWAELNSTSAIMTTSGPATQTNLIPITLSGGNYKIGLDNNDNLFSIVGAKAEIQGDALENCLKEINKKTTITDDKSSCQELGRLPIFACINLTNGASSLIKGSASEERKVTKPNCG